MSGTSSTCRIVRSAELEPSTNAFLYVHHHIREADQQLFGFLTRDERVTFQTLIGTHGVGPALGDGDHRHAPADRAGRHRRQPGRGLAHAGPRRGQEDRRAPARRAEVASAASRCSTASGGSVSGGTAMSDVREALSGLGLRRERDPRHPARADAERRFGRAAARRPQGSGGAPCVTSSSIPGWPPTSRSRSRPACDPGRSTSSSASVS